MRTREDRLQEIEIDLAILEAQGAPPPYIDIFRKLHQTIADVTETAEATKKTIEGLNDPTRLIFHNKPSRTWFGPLSYRGFSETSNYFNMLQAFLDYSIAPSDVDFFRRRVILETERILSRNPRERLSRPPEVEMAQPPSEKESKKEGEAIESPEILKAKIQFLEHQLHNQSPHLQLFRWGAVSFWVASISLATWLLMGIGAPLHPAFAVLVIPASMGVMAMAFLIRREKNQED